jgi:hypothetical protein
MATEIVDLAVEMVVDDLGERADEIDVRIDAVELVGFDEAMTAQFSPPPSEPAIAFRVRLSNSW